MRHVHHDSLHSDQVPDVTDRKERPNRKPQDFPEKLVHFIKDVKKTTKQQQQAVVKSCTRAKKIP